MPHRLGTGVGMYSVGQWPWAGPCMDPMSGPAWGRGARRNSPREREAHALLGEEEQG